MKSLLGTFSQWRHLPGICWGISTSRSAMGETRRYKLIYFPEYFVYLNIILTVGNITQQLIPFHYLLPHISFCLVVSLTENGGVIGQDKEGEAYFYSLLYFGM